jgi:hypothetical protein
MIRVRLSNGAFVFGLDAENVRRLTDGQPIVVDMRPLGGSDKFMLIYGETLDTILAELERANGGPLPPAAPLPQEH